MFRHYIYTLKWVWVVNHSSQICHYLDCPLQKHIVDHFTSNPQNFEQDPNHSRRNKSSLSGALVFVKFFKWFPVLCTVVDLNKKHSHSLTCSLVGFLWPKQSLFVSFWIDSGGEALLCKLKLTSAAQTRPKTTATLQWSGFCPERSCFQDLYWGLDLHTHQLWYADNLLINLNGAAGFERREPFSHFPNGLRAGWPGHSRVLAFAAAAVVMVGLQLGWC